MKNYNDYVSEAKYLLKQIESLQFKIAEMALKVCEIAHGGKTKDDTYTLSRFSNDIGVNRKTLEGWINVHKLVKKCGVENPTPEQWAAGHKVDRVLKDLNSVEQKANGQSRQKKNFRDTMEPEKVKKLFDEVSSGDDTYIQIIRARQLANRLAHMAKTVDFSKAPDHLLDEIKSSLESASDELVNAIYTRKHAS